jgi:glycosyltransferase involved in cell wall biosynthesis
MRHVEIVSHSDLIGGASRAAWRLLQALKGEGLDVSMVVAVKRSDDWRVKGPIGKLKQGIALVRPTVASAVFQLERSPSKGIRSAALLPSRRRQIINSGHADIVNMHWICGETLSISDVGKLKKPVVWTLHDMWAFCGTEHYTTDAREARFRLGYYRENRPENVRGIDLDRWVWRRKRKGWRRPISIVTPSRWLGECAASSVLMRDWDIRVIPNVVDTTTYRPIDKELSRNVLGLPQEALLIGFGAIKGGANPIKGFDLLLGALKLLPRWVVTNLGCVVFGQQEPEKPPSIDMPVHWLGHLYDDVAMALMYSALDAIVIPSRQENLPQIGTEAHSCGCPVVAFNTTGLPDVVVHKETGYLAEPYSEGDLAAGIVWIIEDGTRRARLSARARDRALRLWAPSVVVPEYLTAFEDAIQRTTAD